MDTPTSDEKGNSEARALYERIRASNTVHIDDSNREAYLQYIIEILLTDIVESIESLQDETASIGQVLKTRLEVNQQIKTILCTQPVWCFEALFEAVLAEEPLLARLTAHWSFQDYQKLLQSLLMQTHEFDRLVPALLQQIRLSYDKEELNIEQFTLQGYFFEAAPDKVNLIDEVLEMSLNAGLRARNDKMLAKRNLI